MLLRIRCKNAKKMSELITTNLKLGITPCRISELKENLKATVFDLPLIQGPLCALHARRSQHLLTSLGWQGSHSLINSSLASSAS